MILNLLNFRHPNLEAFFFDFDGVVVDSVPIKTKAFQKIMEKFGPRAVECITNYHLEYGGIDRYTKIRHALEQCQIQHDDTVVNGLADEFAANVKQLVCDEPLMPGMAQLLQDLKNNGVKMFVVSGTPETELCSIVETKGLSPFFIETRGSPKKKTEILSDLISRYGISPQKSLYIGDSRTDFEAAKAFQILFLGV